MYKQLVINAKDENDLRVKLSRWGVKDYTLITNPDTH